MKDSTIRALDYGLGGFQILLAPVYFDPGNWNQIGVSALLLLGGILTLTMDVSSTIVKRIRSVLSFVAILLAAALVVKVLFFD